MRSSSREAYAAEIICYRAHTAPRIASLKMLPDNFPVVSGAELPIGSVTAMAGKISMRAKREITSGLAERYRAGGRREKGRILDELCAVTGWHRKYAIRALAMDGASVGRAAAARPDLRVFHSRCTDCAVGCL